MHGLQIWLLLCRIGGGGGGGGGGGSLSLLLLKGSKSRLAS